MSDRDRAGDAEERYDPAELRARMVVCFSAQELRALADGLGVEGMPGGGSAAEVARALVRQASAEVGLGALVRELRAARPLVEWPKASAPPPAPMVFPDPPALTLPELTPPPPPPPELPPSTPAFEPAPPRVEPWITSGDGVVRPGGQAKVESPAPRLDDPRVLAVIGGIIVLAGLVAFAAARFGGSPSGAVAESSQAVDDSPDSATARALATLNRARKQIARTCEVPSGSEDILVAAFVRCGPAKPEARPFMPIPPAERTAAPSSDEPRAPGRPAYAPLPPGPADGGCMKGCERSHASCKSSCGAEPKEGSQYGAYQSCLSQCLAKASSCRLGCAR